MNVKDLIAKLSECPPEAPVSVEVYDGYRPKVRGVEAVEQGNPGSGQWWVYLYL